MCKRQPLPGSICVLATKKKKKLVIFLPSLRLCVVSVPVFVSVSVS